MGASLAVGVLFVVGAGITNRFPGLSDFVSPLKTQLRAPGETIVGRASVIDGDTIEIHGQRIRFNGIDAPESDQTCFRQNGNVYRCGAEAANFLDAYLAKSSPVTCNFVEWDQYDRYVGDCYRADGNSVAVALVSAGHAVDWPQYSNEAYAEYQDKAWAEQRGMWQGMFDNPWDYRARRRAEAQKSQQQSQTRSNDTGSGACNIKGNISFTTGEKIYHVPGQEFYSQTRITTSKGERWFCSEAEARAAGWRRARH